MIRRPPRSTQSRSSAASDVYKRQEAASMPLENSQGFHISAWCSVIMNTMKNPDAAENTMRTAGDAVRRVRGARDVSLRQLAHRVGVSPATMSAIETGKTGLTVRRLHQIADALDVPATDLLENGQPGPPYQRTGTPPTVAVAT